jgi:hypothetical protein
MSPPSVSGARAHEGAARVAKSIAPSAPSACGAAAAAPRPCADSMTATVCADGCGSGSGGGRSSLSEAAAESVALVIIQQQRFEICAPTVCESVLNIAVEGFKIVEQMISRIKVKRRVVKTGEHHLSSKLRELAFILVWIVVAFQHPPHPAELNQQHC